MDIAEAFGRVLRRARLQAKYTQEGLAFAADLQRNYISLMERGHHQPTISTLVSLSNALECSPLDLLSDTLTELHGVKADGSPQS
ncbi:helix-turn-helix domain-containing protein [Pseudomonas capsici]|uniref:helix-turn-helix domain-containing protein n=1 Tax=Pseudomonas capsici TaxID=2810614 RepID=UPI000F005C82|nr:helix-turn-helix transcriptional regulator [Pseudomonas capsici]MCV4275819.1 helix-turn-helix domain-containing protein [Pseudomonas capsici]